MINNQNRQNNLLAEIEGEIDFGKVSSTLIRNKRNIISATALGFLFGVVYCFIKTPTWEGQFQIVLENKQSSFVNGNNFGGQYQINSSFLNRFSDVTGDPNDLMTELKILESPSILMPIYEFIKSSKEKKGVDLSRLRYYEWIKSALSIDLENKTAVLNLSYRDTDKSLILPVLEKISSTYQDYSGRDRQRGLRQGISYLEEQLIIRKAQSKESMNILQSFSLEHGLGESEGLPLASNSSIKPISINQNLSIRSNAYQNSKNNNSLKNTNQRYSDHFYKLSELEADLAEKSALLKPNSQIIKTLRMQINSLKDSLTRPKEILLKYRELRRTALRDESILESIESKLDTLKLDQARQTNPWELISKPIILEKPVSPIKQKIIPLTTLFGLLSSTIITLFISKISGIIFHKDQFDRVLPYKFIKTFPLKNIDKWNIYIKSFEKFIDNIIKENKNLSFIKLAEANSEIVDSFIDKIKNDITKIDIKIIDKAFSSEVVNDVILIATPGTLSVSQIQLIIEEFSMINLNIIGWIYLDPNL